MQEEADQELKAWEEGIKARELAEKRRVAPGWLDSDARILEPAKKEELRGEDLKDGDGTGRATNGNLMDDDVSSAEASGLQESSATAMSKGGEELDRAFGGMGLQ